MPKSLKEEFKIEAAKARKSMSEITVDLVTRWIAGQQTKEAKQKVE